MNDTGIRPEVIEEIRNLAQKYDIEKVILFGSRARGDFRRTSDIDIAVTGGDFLSLSDNFRNYFLHIKRRGCRLIPHFGILSSN